MRYEQNLFISYAHLDDDPLAPGEQGWITRFHGTLGVFLGQYLGRKATIWRDEKLQGNDVFGDEIVAQFKQSAVLVYVLTPRYLNSEWCTRESREFCAAAQQRGGLLVGNMLPVSEAPVQTLTISPGMITPEMRQRAKSRSGC